MNDKLEAMLKAMNHLASATRFFHDDKRSDTDHELKCAVDELVQYLDDVEVEYK